MCDDVCGVYRYGLTSDTGNIQTLKINLKRKRKCRSRMTWNLKVRRWRSELNSKENNKGTEKRKSHKKIMRRAYRNLKFCNCQSLLRNLKYICVNKIQVAVTEGGNSNYTNGVKKWLRRNTESTLHLTSPIFICTVSTPVCWLLAIMSYPTRRSTGIMP